MFRMRQRRKGEGSIRMEMDIMALRSKWSLSTYSTTLREFRACGDLGVTDKGVSVDALWDGSDELCTIAEHFTNRYPRAIS